MSNEKNINIGLTEITAPNLKENSYGSQLEEKFKNINDNFNKLANREFVKGDKGDSVKFETKSLSTLNKAWKDALKNAIHGVTTEINFPVIDFPIKDPVVIDPPIKDAPIIGDFNLDGSITNLPIEDQQPIGGFNPYDFKGEIAYIKDDKDNILSSLAYVYIDPRFANLKDKEELKNELAQAIDLSCVVYITGGTEEKPIMKKLDLFPTIYYDANINDFCWKFYGEESGIIATGPAGKDGLSSNMVIVRRSETSTSGNVYVIEKMLVGDSWEEIDGSTIKVIDYNNCPAVVLPGENSSQKDSYWLSVLYEDGGALKAICSKENEVLPTFESQDLYKIFAEINPYNDEDKTIKNTPGLFLPINNDNKNVHMIYAEGDKENRNTLVITSVQDLDNNLYEPSGWKQVQGANMRINTPTQITNGLVADQITINNNDINQFGMDYSLGVNGLAVFKNDDDEKATMLAGSTITTQQIIPIQGSLIIGNTTNSVSINGGEITANKIEVGSGETITQIQPGKIITNSIKINGDQAGRLLMADGTPTSTTPIKLNYGKSNQTGPLTELVQFEKVGDEFIGNIYGNNIFKDYNTSGIAVAGNKTTYNYKIYATSLLDKFVTMNIMFSPVVFDDNYYGLWFGQNDEALSNNGYHINVDNNMFDYSKSSYYVTLNIGSNIPLPPSYDGQSGYIPHSTYVSSSELKAFGSHGNVTPNISAALVNYNNQCRLYVTHSMCSKYLYYKEDFTPIINFSFTYISQ